MLPNPAMGWLWGLPAQLTADHHEQGSQVCDRVQLLHLYQETTGQLQLVKCETTGLLPDCHPDAQDNEDWATQADEAQDVLRFPIQNKTGNLW